MKAIRPRSFLPISAVALLASLALAATAHADPVYSTSTLVPYDPTAPSSNFDSASLGSNTTAYTVRTGSDATNFYVDVTANPLPNMDVGPFQFSNIYLGGPSFSGLIFEVTNNRVSTYDDPGHYFNLATTGYTFNATPNDISFALPFSFLETDPLGIGFSKVNAGDLIRVSYSQSFGYSFVGGSEFYPTTMRLGGQTVPNPVPEPSTYAMMVGAGLLFLGIQRARRTA